MALPFYLWSRTAANNATADPTVNWAEGQPPSSVNDSARAMMASSAGYRDDMAGAIVTGGSATAYTVTSYQVFDTLAHLNGQTIAFTPHTTNNDTVTLNVDGLGAKPLYTAPNTGLVAGTLVQGTPYTAIYNSTDGAFYLHGYFSSPYNIPFLGGIDYWDTVTPNSAFIFPAGQALSRTVYFRAFARWGTTYGAGDGSTTFNVPDKTGRVSAMKEAAATRLTASYFGGNSANMGATGGAESNTLDATKIPSHQHDVFLKDPGHIHSVPTGATGSTASVAVGTVVGTQSGNTASATTGITIGSVSGTANDNKTAATGGGAAHANVQPTIVCNYIIRII